MIVLIIISFILSILLYKNLNRSVVDTTVYQNIFDANDPYTEQKLKQYLIDLHVKYPMVAIAQMKLESNNGSSNIFVQGNNLFGMKRAISRPTTSIGSLGNSDNAIYSHWRQSVLDYALWQSFIENPENISTESNWIDYISRYYSKDDSYKNKLLQIKKNLK